MYSCLSLAAVLLSLLGMLLHNSAESDNVFMKVKLADTDSYTPAERILFLTAHPDDECMFFAPTITALTSKMNSGLDYLTEYLTFKTYPEVFSLCLSVGDADGLGNVRRDELRRSLDVLGIKSENREVIDHPYVSSFIVLCGP
jgi:N-acetylglucosaminylphosphatidylinositol deacetylase